MTDQADASTPTPPPELPTIPACTCGRVVQRGKLTCWWCDPSVADERKLEARRGRWEPRIVTSVDLTTGEGRMKLRQAVALAVLQGEIQAHQANSVLKAIADQAADEQRLHARPVGSGAVVVEVQKFDDLSDDKAQP